ncbi:YqaA family protein [Pelagibacterium luteolum]|uniref:Membrane protein YqaA, SNARE-associated domain n=1 Tax=Pelagibacterium luteolum TaxID=440168 RepID=A0A1G7RST0_9HYPH|nr:YqaA family protein [Pelagibacterium luteolum]SDG13772.1 membrane protein YqaA, SNARE-associated domain [Pelagibacterium luteolum]
MLRRLYDWAMDMAASRKAPYALAGVSFAESSFFPIPPDVMLIPMVVADRKSAFWNAALCTVFSVLGGIFGYLIGMYLFEPLARPIIEFYHYDAAFEQLQAWFADYGLLIVFIAGFTPVPYKVFTIASGFAGLALPVFILGSVISRGARFFLVATLLYFFGPAIREFIEKRLGLMTLVFTVLLVGGFAAIRFL